jgi:long-chain fatty acid transport protein
MVFSTSVRRGVLALALVGLTGSSAFATDGYFQYGYGARQKALGGAGVADSRDATAAALNPAGLVHVPDQVDVSVTLFSPWREMDGGNEMGANVLPSGLVESDRNYFLVPNFAWSKHVHDNPLFDVAAVTVYGNGGMNTSYAPVSRMCSDGQGGAVLGAGVFCGGKAGVDLQQALISIAFAKQLTPNLSVGVAPIVARQQFKAFGLGMFGAMGMSADANNLSNNGIDDAWGGGVRGGIEWAVTPSIRLGVAGNSRIYMQEFDKYSGLFAEQGDFDIPASVQAGIAVDLRPNLTLMADYKFINYGAVKSISNPSTNPSLLGSDDGAGFGWHDINIFKLGLEWRATSAATYRVGYSYNDNPIKSRDVMFNVLAPGVVQHHFTAGAEFQISDKLSLELAGAYVPETTVSGYENPPGNPMHSVDISMDQYEVTAGIKYRLGVDPEPLK